MMKKIFRQITKNRDISDIWFIFLINLIISIPLLYKNININLNEGANQLLKAVETYQIFLQDKSINIVSGIANGFGYSYILFEGMFHIYLTIFFSLISNSFNVGLKIILFLSTLISGLTMYKMLQEITEKRNLALVSSTVYIVSPYMFNTVYARCSIDETLVFAFIPLVFLGLYNLFNTEKKHYYFIVGMVGILLTNTTLFKCIAILCVIYLILNIKELKTTRVKKGLLVDCIFIITITSFFWIPLLQTKITTEYRVYNNISKEEVNREAIELKNLFVTLNGSRRIFEVGLPIIAMLVFSIMTYRRLNTYKKEYLFCIISGLICLFCATKYFPWRILPKFICFIRYPWKLLEFSTFFFSIICGVNMQVMVRRFTLRDVVCITILCIIYIYSRHFIVNYADLIPIEDYKIAHISGQNNEKPIGIGKLDYLPIKAYENTYYIATRTDKTVILNGNCNIENEFKIYNFLTEKISNNSDSETILEFPYIYYPGYEIRFDGVISKPIETENGFLGFKIPAYENGTIEISYEGTRLMKFSYCISIITCIVFAIYMFKIF